MAMLRSDSAFCSGGREESRGGHEENWPHFTGQGDHRLLKQPERGAGAEWVCESPNRWPFLRPGLSVFSKQCSDLHSRSREAIHSTSFIIYQSTDWWNQTAPGSGISQA